jgi:hypothetical protein
MSLVFQNIDPLPPSPPGECVLPPNKGGGYILAGRRGGWGRGSIFWKTRDIGLPSYSNNLSTHTPKEDLSSLHTPFVLLYTRMLDPCCFMILINLSGGQIDNANR